MEKVRVEMLTMQQCNDKRIFFVEFKKKNKNLWWIQLWWIQLNICIFMKTSRLPMPHQIMNCFHMLYNVRMLLFFTRHVSPLDSKASLMVLHHNAKSAQCGEILVTFELIMKFKYPLPACAQTLPNSTSQIRQNHQSRKNYDKFWTNDAI